MYLDPVPLYISEQNLQLSCYTIKDQYCMLPVKGENKVEQDQAKCSRLKW